MEELNYSLNEKNLKDIPFDKYEKNFTFIVNGKKYSTNRIVADILSPKIRRLHFSDESIDEFYINTVNIKENHFPDFLNLSNLDNIHLDSTLKAEFSTYFYQLGNIDEYIRIQSECLNSINIENCVSILQTLYEIYSCNLGGIDCQQKNIANIISFISMHFSEISKEEIKELPLEIIEEIISRETLKITDEDLLLDFLIDLYESNSSSSYLFSKVLFDNLSVSKFNEFIKIFNINDLNSELWTSICSRLGQTNSKENKQGEASKKIKRPHKNFPSTNNYEFNGILWHLTNLSGGNVHDNGTVNITSNSINNILNRHPKNLVDFNRNNFYQSNGDPDTYIQFDFMDKPVQISSYTIKSHFNGPNEAGHLRNWVVEVSKDFYEWEEIDRRTNDSTLNGSNKTANFQVSKKLNDFYRYVRLRQTGYSWIGYPSFNRYYTYFNSIEFFGKLADKIVAKK